MSTRTRLLALAALAAGAALAAAAPAQAQAPAGGEPVFTFTGRGWGHGVGMSQHGARGRALAGWSAQRILAHYYRGAVPGRVPPRSVRVLLATGRPAVGLRSPGRWRAVGPRPSGPRLTPLRPGASYALRALAGGRLSLEEGGRRVALFTGPVAFRAAGGAGVAWGPRGPEGVRRYRGALRAVPAGRRLDLVNVVGLEDYLRGVVPREMPASWGDDAPSALAAQAIAARSYALATMRPTRLFDVYDDVRSQVYGGIAAEDPRTTRAVLATRGRVLTHGGRVITAFFFSTSGGRTEDVQNVFRGAAPAPYLVSVPDPFDRGSPFHVWRDPPRFTATRLGRLLRVGGPVREVTVLRRGRSPRVMEAQITTRSGRQVVMSGTAIRAALGLRDTWFHVVRSEPR